MRRYALALALSLAALPATAAMQTTPVEWRVGEAHFSGYMVYDDASSAKRPGLVMVPNWMGVTDDAVARAKAIAGADYVVLVADMYGKGKQPKNAGEAGKLAGSLRGEEREPLRARIEGAVAALKAQAVSVPLDATKIGAFGFCFGGSAVLELARAGSDVAGVVSLHGGLAPGAQSSTHPVKTAVLVLNGASDKSVTDAHVTAFGKEMDTAGADWQFVNFSGAVHCFAEPSAGNAPATNCAYDERAAVRAYRMMADFFRERFAL